MAEEEDQGEKPHEASQHKLDKAREKGEVPRSQDLTAAASYGGLCIAAVALGGQALIRLGDLLQGMLDRADETAGLLLSDGGATVAAGLMAAVGTAMLPLFGIPLLAVLATIIATRAFIVSGSKIAPKLSRISPLSNARNKFGRGGLFEFGKSFAKLLIYSVCLYIFVSSRLPEMVQTLYLGPGIAVSTLLRLCIEFLLIVFIVALCIGGIDFLWQRAEHMRKNRMSDKEIRDEYKDSEGDPHMKQQRRARGEAIARQQMMAEVPKADVVIVNPTHYAVALKWNRERGSAPVCVAKGVDEIARVIRETAFAANVPVHSDPPTARKIHATTEVGQEIQPADYRAVAAAIRFADRMRDKARGRV